MSREGTMTQDPFTLRSLIDRETPATYRLVTDMNTASLRLLNTSILFNTPSHRFLGRVAENVSNCRRS